MVRVCPPQAEDKLEANRRQATQRQLGADFRGSVFIPQEGWRHRAEGKLVLRGKITFSACFRIFMRAVANNRSLHCVQKAEILGEAQVIVH